MYPRRPCVLSLSREVVGKSECNLNLLKRNSALVCHVARILDSESESAKVLHSAPIKVSTEAVDRPQGLTAEWLLLYKLYVRREY